AQRGRVRSGLVGRSQRIAVMSENDTPRPQVALVTGASRGIGRAIAVTLARQGFVVYGIATTDAGAQAISEALSSHSGCHGLTLDVTDAAAVDAALDGILEDQGALDVLGENAGDTGDRLAMRVEDGA